MDFSFIKDIAFLVIAVGVVVMIFKGSLLPSRIKKGDWEIDLDNREKDKLEREEKAFKQYNSMQKRLSEIKANEAASVDEVVMNKKDEFLQLLDDSIKPIEKDMLWMSIERILLLIAKQNNFASINSEYISSRLERIKNLIMTIESRYSIDVRKNDDNFCTGVRYFFLDVLSTFIEMRIDTNKNSLACINSYADIFEMIGDKKNKSVCVKMASDVRGEIEALKSIELT
jgi:hypothetical protein